MVRAEALPPIRVQVAVGVGPQDVRMVSLELPAGSTVWAALEASSLVGQVDDLSEEALAAGLWSVGVWGRKERMSHVLRERDRIEIVRCLKVDPKEARRVRYRAQGTKRTKAIRQPKVASPGESN